MDFMGQQAFTPKFLTDLLSPFHVVSSAECLLQSFMIRSSSRNELSVLAIMVFDICGYMSAIREPLCDDQEKNISISCLLLAFTVMIVPCGRLWLCF